MAGKKIDWPEYGRHAFLLAYIVAVVAGIVCFRLFAPSLPLLIVWWILLGIHFFYTAAVLAEGLAAVIYDFLPRAPIPHVLTSEKKRKYRITVLIAAYLPNEQDLILETVAHWLTRINFGTVPYRVVLSYNTPKPLPVEQQLAALAAVEPRLTVISTPDSKSKARNVNYALTQIPPINPDEFEIVSVMDADHLPREDVYEYVLSNFESRPELDIVQGRCVIRNVRDTWVTRVISVEFDMIYNLYHVGRTLVHRFGLFGGTNGHWRRQVLQEITFKEDLLTEDIDSSIRSTIAGYKVWYDNRIISTELAPLTIDAYLKQRKRWAQGWLQVTLLRLWPMLRHGKMSVWGKFWMFNLLLVRELSFHINLILTVFVVTSLAISPSFTLLWLPPIITTAVTALIMARLCSQKVFAVFFYACLYVPYYGLQTYIVLISHVLEVFKVHEWKVTSREGASKALTVGFQDIFAQAEAAVRMPVEPAGPAPVIPPVAGPPALFQPTTGPAPLFQQVDVVELPDFEGIPAIQQTSEQLAEVQQHQRASASMMALNTARGRLRRQSSVMYGPTHPNQRASVGSLASVTLARVSALVDGALGFTAGENYVNELLGIETQAPAQQGSSQQLNGASNGHSAAHQVIQVHVQQE